MLRPDRRGLLDNQERLLHFVTGRLGRLDGVRDIETFIILKVIKFSYESEIA